MGGKLREGLVVGSTAEFIEVRQFKMAQGQFLPREDWNRGSQVMVIGAKLRAELFPNVPRAGPVRARRRPALPHHRRTRRTTAAGWA